MQLDHPTPRYSDFSNWESKSLKLTRSPRRINFRGNAWYRWTRLNQEMNLVWMDFYEVDLGVLPFLRILPMWEENNSNVLVLHVEAILEEMLGTVGLA